MALAVLLGLWPRSGSAQEALPAVVPGGPADVADAPAPVPEPLLVFGKDGETPIAPSSGGDWAALSGVAFWTFLVLALLALALYGLKRLSGGGRGLLGAETVQVIGRRGLSPRHTLFLVEAGGSVFLIGATRDRLASLGEIRDPEAVRALRARAGSAGGGAPGGGLFGKFLGGKLRDYEPPAHETGREKDVADILGEIGDIRKTIAGWKPPKSGPEGNPA